MAQHIGPNIVTDGLVVCLDAADKASYPGSGTVWTDLSGIGNQGALSVAAVGTDISGTMEFNGSDEYAYIGDSASITDVDSLTLSIWVKPVDNPASTAYMDMIFKERAAAADSGYVMMTDYDRIRCEFRIGGSNINAHGRDGTFLLRNEYYHCVATFNNTENTMSFYQDGKLHETVAASGDPEFGDGKDLYFGRAGNGSRYSNCRIAVVNIYNKALTQKEVLQNFNAHRGRFGL
tara:strand:+ start:989 stop:1690 length:702 start_codon:yes stop_codon:yes gene_type:complete